MEIRLNAVILIAWLGILGCGESQKAVDSTTVQTSKISASFLAWTNGDGTVYTQATLRESWEIHPDPETLSLQTTPFLELNGADQLFLIDGEQEIPMLPMEDTDHLHYEAQVTDPSEMPALNFAFVRADGRYSSTVLFREPFKVIEPTPGMKIDADLGTTVTASTPFSYVDLSGPCIKKLHVFFMLTEANTLSTGVIDYPEGQDGATCDAVLRVTKSSKGTLASEFDPDTGFVEAYQFRDVPIQVTTAN